MMVLVNVNDQMVIVNVDDTSNTGKKFLEKKTG